MRDLEVQLTQLSGEAESANQRNVHLKNENQAPLERPASLEKQFTNVVAEKKSLDANLSQANGTNAALLSQNQQNVSLLEETRSELERLKTNDSQTAATMIAERQTTNELTQELADAKASLDRERQMLAAGRDIRDIMGARQLHMIDVYDADGTSRNTKSFGRVFYSEGKSLVFYAYDLDDKKVVNAKYSFEGWGQRLGQPSSVKSLGLLFSDDKGQKRWVLKVNDPEQLAEIDSVFVTLEPKDGGEKPKGKKLLYAFLGGKANHP